MIDETNIAGLIGATVLDQDGDKLGTVGQVYVDPDSGRPLWLSVRTGLFGMSESFVPITDATTENEDIRVPYAKNLVKDAPRIDADGALSEADEAELYRHYDLDNPAGSDFAATSGQASDTRSDTVTDRDPIDTRSDDERDTVGRDTSGATTDDAMTLSEERLRVGTERVDAGRARLRKYVVTENETVTVPVSREEVRLEREPITADNIGDAQAGPEISEEEHEVTLSEDRVVVDKETVPVERVRLDTETVTEQRTVEDEVRKEQIDVDQPNQTQNPDPSRSVDAER